MSCHQILSGSMNLIQLTEVRIHKGKKLQCDIFKARHTDFLSPLPTQTNWTSRKVYATLRLIGEKGKRIGIHSPPPAESFCQYWFISNTCPWCRRPVATMTALQGEGWRRHCHSPAWDQTLNTSPCQTAQTSLALCLENQVLSHHSNSGYHCCAPGFLFKTCFRM